MGGFIDKIAKRFVKTATVEVVTELKEIKNAVFDGLPSLVMLGVLVYSVAALRSTPSKKIVEKGAATVVQHLYLGGTINIHH